MKPNVNHHHPPPPVVYPEDDEDANSLDGHGGNSDFEDDEFFQQERPNSRLSVHNNNNDFHSNHKLRRPHYKQTKQSNKTSTYDDYRFLDEQQQQQQHPQQSLSSPNKSKQSTRSTHKEFPQPTFNRIGSSNPNQSATNRLKSGSKSSSTESIPTLDLTVAGQKVFRKHPQQQIDVYLPPTNSMRPPSGRLKPLNSAKSSSSYTDDLSPTSSKTLEDVTNNVKQIHSAASSATTTKTHLYKKKLAPLSNGSDMFTKKPAYRSSIDQPSYLIDDLPSDKSEETSTSVTNTTRDMKPSVQWK